MSPFPHCVGCAMTSLKRERVSHLPEEKPLATKAWRLRNHPEIVGQSLDNLMTHFSLTALSLFLGG